MSSRPYNSTANEPEVHPIIKKGEKRSFIFVPSAGMRLAPEVLVLELMREVFFEQRYGETTGTQNLDPENDSTPPYFLTPEHARERAILHALRGRRKDQGKKKEQRFFAPAYPQLAKKGWMGKNRERVINNFLFSGPLAQYLWHSGQNSVEARKRQKKLVEQIRKALVGNKSCLNTDLQGKDIFATTLGTLSFESFADASDTGVAITNLMKKTGDCDSVIQGIHDDELANRITQDFIAICDLEARLPRMQWIQILMTFLRFALPMWILAQMQITRLIHAWLLEAIDNGQVVDDRTVRNSLMNRNRSLLHPTMTPTRELYEHIDRYMACRVELNIFLHYLGQVRGKELHEKTLNLEGGGKNWISIDELLTLACDASTEFYELERFTELAGGLTVRTFLKRESEQYQAWRNPRSKSGGVGKNIDEFFRVLYRAEIGDEAGGYLLTSEGRGLKRGFKVFPGQLLLKTITYLAAQEKRSRHDGNGGGMLVLQDIEYHFSQYGIDFSSAADTRPLLMNELQNMGLLMGSPDAGSSVTVACPYELT
jgi:hypothetical protein